MEPPTRISARTLVLEPGTPLRVHDGVHLAFVHTGSVGYAFGSRQLDLGPGQIVLFWAAVPRQLLRLDQAVQTVVEIPLPRFLGWRLPKKIVGRLLSGLPCFGLRGDIEEITVAKWEDELGGNDPFLRRSAELEVQACVLRMARNARSLEDARSGDQPAQRMVAHILQNMGGPLSVADVSRAGGLHPNHAMRVFRRATGTTICEFVLSHRIARAKHFLLTTDLPVGEVAYHSGFGSDRRLFEVFRDRERTTPLKYRRAGGNEGGQTFDGHALTECPRVR